ncbi:MAG: AraC family transcriptional regulator [Paracoccaceae bacterium]
MEMITQSTAAILGPKAAYHFARIELSRSKPRALHSQDYYELFWLINGRAHHYTGAPQSPNRQTLSEGDLVFMPPNRPHALQGLGEDAHLVNLVIQEEVIKRLSAHAFGSRYFWGDGPQILHRDMRQLSSLSHEALALETAPRSALYIEAFLLSLLAQLEREAPGLPDSAPKWLVEACKRAHDPEIFCHGAAGLASVARKSHAHVSRSLQKHLGQTPSDYMNHIRMEHAARCLAGTGEPLAEIAQSCGIANMSHFHRLFRAQHGLTPRQYRQRFQKDVAQPI